MQLYRLLRSNKESGPYTLRELADLPLKPYDLVWVEGKSAAWRYPSELPEFKGVAPAIEQDLYQQFYKKPAAVADPVTSAQGTTTAPAKEPQRKVSVILPVSSATPKTVKTPEPVVVAPTPPPKAAATATPEPIQEFSEIPPAAPKTFRSKPAILIPRATMQRAVFTVAIIAVVVVAILLLTNKNQENLEETAALPAIQASSANEEINDDILSLPENPHLELAALKRHLQIQPTHISVGLFGGINRLALTITNNHTKSMEQVSVAVDFLNANQLLDHTEVVDVNEIPAKGTVVVRVPANGKGRAVQTRVIGIGPYSTK